MIGDMLNAMHGTSRTQEIFADVSKEMMNLMQHLIIGNTMKLVCFGTRVNQEPIQIPPESWIHQYIVFSCEKKMQFPFLQRYSDLEDIVRDTSRQLYVYKSLVSILPDLLKHDIPQRKEAAELERVFQDSPLKVACRLLERGFHPLLHCSIPSFRIADEQLVEWTKRSYTDVVQNTSPSSFQECLQNTSLIYPFRSPKCRKITHVFSDRFQMNRQCMCCYIPNVMVYKKNHQLVDMSNIRFVHVGLITNIHSIPTDSSVEKRQAIIKAKLTCLFDMALHQRDKLYPHGLDSLVLTNLDISTASDRKLYDQSIDKLYEQYKFYFRKIIVCY